MPDGENAAMNREQVSRPHPVLDQAFVQAQSRQLPPGDDAMLPLRQGPDLGGGGGLRNALFVICIRKTLHRRPPCSRGVGCNVLWMGCTYKTLHPQRGWVVGGGFECR